MKIVEHGTSSNFLTEQMQLLKMLIANIKTFQLELKFANF